MGSSDALASVNSPTVERDSWLVLARASVTQSAGRALFKER